MPQVKRVPSVEIAALCESPHATLAKHTSCCVRGPVRPARSGASSCGAADRTRDEGTGIHSVGDTHAHTHMNISTHTHVSISTYIHTHNTTYTQPTHNTHTTHTPTHTNTHTCIHTTYRHTHTYIYTYCVEHKHTPLILLHYRRACVLTSHSAPTCFLPRQGEPRALAASTSIGLLALQPALPQRSAPGLLVAKQSCTQDHASTHFARRSTACPRPSWPPGPRRAGRGGQHKRAARAWAPSACLDHRGPIAHASPRPRTTGRLPDA